MACRSTSFPTESVLAPGLATYDYADSYSLDLSRDISVDEAVNAFCGPLPTAVRILMSTRDFVAGRLGLKTSRGYAAGDPSAPVVCRPGDRMGLFLVMGRHEREIVLGEDDSHLDFRVSVLVRPRSVVVSTVVTYNNRLGRIYFAAVKPFHRWIVSRTLPADFKPFL